MERRRLLGILSVLMAFASISTDLYLPAMPAMGRDLHASPGAVAFTVSGYLVGFSIGQLVWGPVGDRYGRRVPIAVGLALFVCGSVGCALAGDVESMIAWRVAQALGACASVVLARAMVRDLYEGHRAAQMLSLLLTVMAIAPLVGPLIGGQILLFLGWRAIFWALVGIGIVTGFALFTIPETLPPEKRNAEPLTDAFASYGALLRDRTLLGYAGAGGFLYGGIFAYVAGTPFAYITYYHVPAQAYGLLFGLGSLGIMGANFWNARVVRRAGSDRLMRSGAAAASCAGVVLALDTFTGFAGLAGLVIPLFVFVAASGFIVANAVVGALARFPGRAGTVSALVGAAQYGSGVAGSALVGAFANGTPRPLGCVVAICGIFTLLCTSLVSSRAGAVLARDG